MARSIQNPAQYAVSLVNSSSVLLVDEQDYAWVNSHEWYLTKTKAGLVCAYRKGEYGRQILFHRELAQCDERDRVFHQNGDLLDGRRFNWRRVDASEYLKLVRARPEPIRRPYNLEPLSSSEKSARQRAGCRKAVARGRYGHRHTSEDSYEVPASIMVRMRRKADKWRADRSEVGEAISRTLRGAVAIARRDLIQAFSDRAKGIARGYDILDRPYRRGKDSGDSRYPMEWQLARLSVPSHEDFVIACVDLQSGIWRLPREERQELELWGSGESYDPILLSRAMARLDHYVRTGVMPTNPPLSSPDMASYELVPDLEDEDNDHYITWIEPTDEAQYPMVDGWNLSQARFIAGRAK